MKPISRRLCLKQIGFVVGASALPVFFDSRSSGATEAEVKPSFSELKALADIGQQFLDQYKAPGLSVAISRHGQIVYAEGFGVADKATGEGMTPSHLFRICSVSKPITAVAIYLLIEQNKLKLDDLVFGPQGVLGADYPNIDQPFAGEITVRHLLTQTCGGWGNDRNDPMFVDARMDRNELIRWTLKNCPLEHKPGTHYAYSNFGYCLLGRVLEKISGQSYEKFVKSNIFQKCGIRDMQLGGNTLAERARNEVVYYDQKGENPYNMNVRRMDSHGGWIGTASDVVKFAMHVDGFNSTRNILSKKTIDTMMTATVANPSYASGWMVNSIPNWWHDGNLPGSVSIMVRTARGLCWAACANTRCAAGPDLDRMMWKMARAVPAWGA